MSASWGRGSPLFFLTKDLSSACVCSAEYYKKMELEEPGKEPAAHILTDVINWDGKKSVWEVMGGAIQEYIKFQNWLALCHIDLKAARDALKDNGGCPAKLLGAADEAWALFCHLNNAEKWQRIAQNADNLEHECHASKSGGLYAKTIGRGQYKSGYSEEGMAKYRLFLDFFRRIRKDDSEKWEEVCSMSREEFKKSSDTRAYRVETKGSKDEAMGATGGEEKKDAPTLDSDLFGDSDDDSGKEEDMGEEDASSSDGDDSDGGNGSDEDDEGDD